MQNKKFCIKLTHRCYREILENSEHDIHLFFYYFIHMKMKKMLLWAFLGMFTLAGIAVLPNYANADSAWTTNWAQPDAGKQMIWDQELTGSKLLDTIKNAINRCMWILATIALAICLYGWFMMVVSAGDDGKYQSGLKVLKNAAIGLAIIGLSWMIVSVVFRAIGTLWWKSQTKGGDTTSIQSDQGDLRNAQ